MPIVNTNKKLLKKRKENFPIVWYFTWKLGLASNILSMVVALIHTMRKSKTSNPYTSLYNPSIYGSFIYDLRKVKNFDRSFSNIYNHPILACPFLCCTTVNVYNWIQKDSFVQKMMLRNIPHKLQEWDQYTYT